MVFVHWLSASDHRDRYFRFLAGVKEAEDRFVHPLALNTFVVCVLRELNTSNDTAFV